MSERPEFGFDFDAASTPPSVEAFVTALFEAGPEAAEHLVKAAEELLLAAKAVVDAGERAVVARRAATEHPGGDDAPTKPDAGEPGRRIRRIDLA